MDADEMRCLLAEEDDAQKCRERTMMKRKGKTYQWAEAGVLDVLWEENKNYDIV